MVSTTPAPVAGVEAGTRKVRPVAVLLAILVNAVTPFTVRAVTLPRSVPVRVIICPSPLGEGESVVITGTAAMCRVPLVAVGWAELPLGEALSVVRAIAATGSTAANNKPRSVKRKKDAM